jgi:hypothetical protein
MTSREGRLTCQISGGMGHDVRVVGVHGVQRPLRAEPAEPTEQGISAPLQGRWSRLQDPEASTIHSFSLFINFSY